MLVNLDGKVAGVKKVGCVFFFGHIMLSMIIIACLPNHYGPGCKAKCWCYGRSSKCDRFTGVCQCPPGYTGAGCWNGRYC